MDPDAQLRAMLASHAVIVDRLDPIPAAWHALLEEAVVRLAASGWRHRRVAQVKEKFGSLRIYLDATGESAAFLEAARHLTGELLERSQMSNSWSADVD